MIDFLFRLILLLMLLFFSALALYVIAYQLAVLVAW